MSLDFDTTRLADQSITTVTRDGHDYWSEETTSVVFATMPVGINYITEKNYTEFYKRYVAWNLTLGYEPSQNFITLEMVRQHIGLSTNASPRTAAQFKKLLAETALDQAERKLQEQLKEADKDTYTIAQEMALKADPELTGDDLDRIGNLIVDQAPAPHDITGPMLDRAISTVKQNRMEK